MGIVEKKIEECFDSLIHAAQTNDELKTLSIGIIEIEVHGVEYQVQVVLNPNRDEVIPVDQIEKK